MGDEIRLRAAMPWTIIIMLFVLAFGAILWYALDPLFVAIIDIIDPFAEGHEHSQKGLASVETVWEYWPLWFLAAVGIWGVMEAIRKSRAQGRRF